MEWWPVVQQHSAVTRRRIAPGAGSMNTKRLELTD